MVGDLHIRIAKLAFHAKESPIRTRTKSSILYLHSLGVRPITIVRLSGHPQSGTPSDVKTAFLNGFLEEELYMMQPKGFVDPKGANKVCKLQRSIDGLVQASWSWNKRFDSVIKAFGFVQTFGEACISDIICGCHITDWK